MCEQDEDCCSSLCAHTTAITLLLRRGWVEIVWPVCVHGIPCKLREKWDQRSGSAHVELSTLCTRKCWLDQPKGGPCPSLPCCSSLPHHRLSDVHDMHLK